MDNGEIYEGEFLNGKINGEGILYNENGSIKYKGNFEDGKYNLDYIDCEIF